MLDKTTADDIARTLDRIAGIIAETPAGKTVGITLALAEGAEFDRGDEQAAHLILDIEDDPTDVNVIWLPADPEYSNVFWADFGDAVQLLDRMLEEHSVPVTDGQGDGVKVGFQSQAWV